MRLAVLDDYLDCASTLADWSALKPEVTVEIFTQPLATPATTLAPYAVICCMRERTAFPRDLLRALPNLRLLVSSGARNAAIDVAAAAELGIDVAGTEAPGGSTIELTWALILGLTKRLHDEDRAMRAGDWQQALGGELAGRTLGVVGLGRIGAAVARLGQAFGMRVVAWSPNLDDARAAEAGAERVDKETLFRTADIVTLHLKLGERSRGVVGARELAWMREDALLVNTARGPLVDEAALIEALGAGRIGGAALDVYDVEPLPGTHPLRQLGNVLLSPHKGYVTDATMGVFYRQSVEAVRAWLDGRPLRKLVG